MVLVDNKAYKINNGDKSTEDECKVRRLGGWGANKKTQKIEFEKRLRRQKKHVTKVVEKR